jgi:hypothetical protein
MSDTVRLGVCYRPGGVWVTKAQFEDAVPTSITFWFKRKSHFRLSEMTTFIADSHEFTLPIIWHFTGVWLPEGYASRD